MSVLNNNMPKLELALRRRSGGIEALNWLAKLKF
jgi:23S rRNA maturation-related 3'-5' exoribonuclease YhaM